MSLISQHGCEGECAPYRIGAPDSKAIYGPIKRQPPRCTKISPKILLVVVVVVVVVVVEEEERQPAFYK